MQLREGKWWIAAAALIAVGTMTATLAIGPLAGAAKIADKAYCAKSYELNALRGRDSQHVLNGVAVASRGTPGIIPCVGSPQRRPTKIVLACADYNSYVDKLSWSSWTARGATGHGTLVENDCTPSCVAGKFYSYRVVVELGKAVTTRYGLLFTTYKVSARSPIRPMLTDTLTGTFATRPEK
jgi:hypothetical protein